MKNEVKTYRSLNQLLRSLQELQEKIRNMARHVDKNISDTEVRGFGPESKEVR